MDTIPDPFTLSLRPWPSSNPAPGTLRNQILPQIHAQRGNFRNISEDILEKEISAAEAEDTAKDNEPSSDDEEEEEASDPLKELNAAKEQMVLQTGQALQSAQFALDTVCLLLSKWNPNHAGSISATIREAGDRNIPIGTVGADKVRGPRRTEAQKLETRRVTKGWKMLSLNKSVDSILAAANRLEQVMDAEAKYWEDVLSVREQGWAVSYATRTSQFERQNLKKTDGTLTVRFGFSESAPEFRNRGMAILRRTDDGSIALETDVLRAKPKRLQVRIIKNGIESGHSVFSLFDNSDSSVQSQVREARNSIFEQELWHELLRESRDLVAYGVVTGDYSINVPLSPTKAVLLSFAAESEEVSSPFASNEDSNIANTICIAVHLLLSYSHRLRLRQRSQTPPPISAENHGNVPPLPCRLLRPVIAHLYHQAAISSLHSLLSPITKILESAGFSASYHIIQKLPQLQTNLAQYIYSPHSISEKVIESLIESVQGEAMLTISQDHDGDTREIKFNILFRTWMIPVISTNFKIMGGASWGFKPPQHPIGLAETKDYLLFAITCAIASFFAKSPATTSIEQSSAAHQNSNGPDPESVQPATTDAKASDSWQITIHQNVIRKTVPDTNEIREVSFIFSFVEIPADEYSSTSNNTDTQLASANSNAPTPLFASSKNKENKTLALKADRKYSFQGNGVPGVEENRRRGGTSIWGVGGGERRRLREVVEGALEGQLSTVVVD